MTEKQPDWIDKVMEDIDTQEKNNNLTRSIIEWVIRTHLPKESTYESGYQKGREDMKREIRSEIEMIHIEGNIEVCYLESLLSPTDTK